MAPDIRVRIAPSPTGPLHIGTARTALFNYLFARHTGGTFVLRLEDTDVARSTEAFEQDILDGLHWLGIDWDEGPAVAERDEIGPVRAVPPDGAPASYAAAAAPLLARIGLPLLLHARGARGGPPGAGGREGGAALRRSVRGADRRGARRPGGRGPSRGAPVPRAAPASSAGTTSSATGSRSTPPTSAATSSSSAADGTPLYHFTVVVDDMAMAISHVIRGEDHVSNTPKHILLFEALGYPLPVFAHLPLILNPDGTKMRSARARPRSPTTSRRASSREALVNYFAFLGWSPGTEEDVLSLDEIEQRFELDEGPEGRRPVRPRAARVAQRPVDPATRRRRPRRAAAAVPRGRGGRRRRSTGCPPRTRCARCCRSSASGCRPSPRSSTSSGFLWVDELAVDPALLVPKRWDAATTAEGLAAAARAPGGARRRDLGGRRARAAAARARRGARLEGRRPVHGDPGRDDRADRDAAAVRHARRPRARADARADRRGDREPRAVAGA